MDKSLKKSEPKEVQMDVPIAGPLDIALFQEEVRKLRLRPAHGRVVDEIQPLRAQIIALQEEGRTLKEIWEVAIKVGLRSSYTTFVRAFNQLVAETVTPLQEARRRSRAKKADEAPMTVPTSIAAKVTAAAPVAQTVPASGLGNPLLKMETQNLAAGFNDFVVKSDTVPQKSTARKKS